MDNTLKQQIRAFLQVSLGVDLNTHSENELNTFAENVESLLPKWVPVTEALPDNVRHVEVANQELQQVGEAWYSEFQKCWVDADFEVTHWKERCLPPSPEN